MNAIIVYALLKRMIDPQGDLADVKQQCAELRADVDALQAIAEDLEVDVEAIQNVLDGLQKGFDYKGSVATRSNLPANPEVGDCYTVTNEDNAECLWDGSNWIDLGSSITAITKAQINALFT